MVKKHSGPGRNVLERRTAHGQELMETPSDTQDRECVGSPKQLEWVVGEPRGCGNIVEHPSGYGMDHRSGCCWHVGKNTYGVRA